MTHNRHAHPALEPSTFEAQVEMQLFDDIDEAEDDELNHFQGGSLTCMNELNLFYLCFNILGDDMKAIPSITAIIDAAMDRALGTFLTDNSNIRLLLHLSSFPQVQERLYPRLRMIMQEFLERSGDDTSPVLKGAWTEIVRNLSRSNANKQAIYRDFLQTLCHDLTSGETLKIKRYSLGALNNLATLEENAVALFRKPHFVETILDLTIAGGTPTIRERALWTLQSLACADENEVPMFDTPLLVGTLVSCVEKGDTNDIKAYAIETLRNLANQNKSKMIANRALMGALLDVVIYGPTELRDLALSCFLKMGFEESKVRGFHMMQTLCSVRDMPRLCNPGCQLQELPNELIRKMSEMMFCSSA
jgi:hypothetical protein